MSYEMLHREFEQVGRLRHAQAMLTWDEAVMMPAGGGAARAEALATLAAMEHRLVSAPPIGDWTAEALTNERLDGWRRANVHEMRRAWQRARALPEALVAEFSRASSRCEQLWRKARPANDWAGVEDALDRVMALARERAQGLAAALNMHPYDALMDGYEPGLNRALLDPLFARLTAELPAIIDRAIATQPKPLPLAGPFPAARQEALGRMLMERLGFDFARGRLDLTHHPFCGGDPDDVRVTTRHNEEDFLESMFAVLHETGHAMYEQGLPEAWRAQPVGESGGMALHESQSLFMEMQVCRGPAFLDFAAPLIRQALGRSAEDPAWSAGNLHRAATRVQRSRIRVQADETTYPLHVILRYELEQALIDGELQVRDLPEAWNARSKALLDLNLGDNHRDGCLQDVHWYGGIVGYFPTYTLGAVAAAQLFQAAAAALPDLHETIREGNFAPLLAWLRRNVHAIASSRDTAAIIAQATGAPLGVEAFLRHLRDRYGG